MTCSTASGAGCRFVTQQGELVEADGTLYVGTVPSENAVLSRKSELRQLRNEIIRLDRTITSEVDRLGWLTSSLTDHDGRLAAADQDFQLVSAQHRRGGDPARRRSSRPWPG